MYLVDASLNDNAEELTPKVLVQMRWLYNFLLSRQTWRLYSTRSSNNNINNMKVRSHSRYSILSSASVVDSTVSLVTGDKAVRVIFPCHRGMPALTTKTVRQTVLDVLRTYPYQNAAFRIISKHPERLSVSSTDSRLGAIPLEIKLQLPPSVVRGLQEKRKIRDKSHRKNHQ